jgi:hypothetical protein
MTASSNTRKPSVSAQSGSTATRRQHRAVTLTRPRAPLDHALASIRTRATALATHTPFTDSHHRNPKLACSVRDRGSACVRDRPPIGRRGHHRPRPATPRFVAKTGRLPADGQDKSDRRVRPVRVAAPRAKQCSHERPAGRRISGEAVVSLAEHMWLLLGLLLATRRIAASDPQRPPVGEYGVSRVWRD